MGDRWCTSDGWGIEVIRMAATPDRHDGESVRVSHHGYWIGYARSVCELLRWVELADLEEVLSRSARRNLPVVAASCRDTGIRATGGGHLWSRAHTTESSRESLPGRPEMVVSPQRSQQVSTAPEGRPRWEKGAKVL
jgi:hypothetical protein